MFNIGDKAVCVDDGPGLRCDCPSQLKKDAIYVVIGVDPVKDYFGINGVFLLGIKNKHFCKKYYSDGGFAPRRLRKLDELKQEAKQKLEQVKTL